MKSVTVLDENVAKDIGHAFAFYDYGTEHGLIDAFPSRDAVSAFICGYVRMAQKSGMLYTTSENGEGFIAYKLPGQKVRPTAALPMIKGVFGSMKPKEIIRFMRIMSKGGSGLGKRLDKEKSRISMSGWSVSGKRIRAKVLCERLWIWRSPRATASAFR